MTDIKPHQFYKKHPHKCHLIAIALGISAIYWPVYQFDFLMGWDDQWFVLNRYTENGINWQNVKAILTSFHYGQYAPANQLYYTVLHAVFGYNTLAFHVSSIVIHMSNAFLVYGLLITITRKLTTKTGLPVLQAGFIGAFAFAILPINIEPVAWVSASKVLLYGLFYLLSLRSYCTYLDTQKGIHYYLTILWFTLSFGAKEQAVLLPVCLILLDYVYRRDFSSRLVWLEKAPFFVLALLYGIATIQSQELDEGGRSFYGVYQRIPLVAYTISEYFTKTIIPVNLSYLYPFPFDKADSVPGWLWLYPIALPVIGYCFHDQLKKRWLFFGVSFFIIHILLVANLFTLARHSVIADRYTYIATIGICFLFGYLLAIKFKKPKWILAGLVVSTVYFGLLVVYGMVHVRVWTDTYELKKKLKYTIESREDYPSLKK